MSACMIVYLGVEPAGDGNPKLPTDLIANHEFAPLVYTNYPNQQEGKGAWIVACYASLRKSLESVEPTNDETWIIFADMTYNPLSEESHDLNTISPVSSNAATSFGLAWSNVVAMLALTFPEAYWIFRDSSDVNDVRLAQHCWNPRETLPPKMLARAQHGVNSLFDATGLHHVLFANIDLDLYGTSLAPPKLPFTWGVAVDEEEEYAFFHSYVISSLGCGALPVTTRRLFDHLFNTGLEGFWHGLVVSVEDKNLEFPDNPNNIVPKRDNFPALRSIKGIFVTGTPDMEPKPQGDLPKPTQGITPLRNLLTQTTPSLKEVISTRRQEMKKKRDSAKPSARSMSSPPDANQPITHSAPGRLQVVARALKERAVALLDKATTVREAITAARYAQIAERLLDGRTPTLALEILALRHRAEVKAEGMFYGVSPDPDSETRYKQIRDETCFIGRYFGLESQKKSILSATIHIVDEITVAYRANNQFDAEMNFLSKSRELRAERRLAELEENFDDKRHPRLEAYDWVLFTILLLITLATVKLTLFHGRWASEASGIIFLLLWVVLVMTWVFLTVYTKTGGFLLRRLWYKYRDFSLRNLKSLMISQYSVGIALFLLYLVVFKPISQGVVDLTANTKAGGDSIDDKIIDGALHIGSAFFNMTSATLAGQSALEFPDLLRANFLIGPLLGGLAFTVGVVQTGLFLAYLYTRLSRR